MYDPDMITASTLGNPWWSMVLAVEISWARCPVGKLMWNAQLSNVNIILLYSPENRKTRGSYSEASKACDKWPETCYSVASKECGKWPGTCYSVASKACDKWPETCYSVASKACEKWPETCYSVPLAPPHPPHPTRFPKKNHIILRAQILTNGQYF